MSKGNWYSVRGTVVLMLIIFWPVGLYGLWKSGRFSKSSKMALSGLPILIMLVSHLLPSMLSNHRADSGQLAELSNPQRSADAFVIGFAADGSKKLDTEHALDHYRFYRFAADYDFGETPPAAITVSGSGRSASKTYLTQAVHTSAMESPSPSWREIVYYLYIISLILSGLLSLGVIEKMLSPSGIRRKLGVTTIVFVGLAICFGCLSGSRLVLDNATEKTLEVRINGKKTAVLPPSTYLEERIG